MSETTVVFTFSVVIIAGIFAGRAADIYHFPKTIPLILTGILLGLADNTYLIDLTAIRDTTVIIAELALITILFREGMHLKLNLIRKHILIILTMAIFGTIITTIVVGTIVGITFALSLSLAMLFGAIFTPTDPAATFAILQGKGQTRIKEKIEIILGGESALNDVIAIILVVAILIPAVTSSNIHNTGLNLSLDIFLLAIWEFIGGGFIGLLVGLGSLFLIRKLSSRTEESFVTFGATTLIFALGFLTNTSSAISALVAGIVLANPKLFKQPEYVKTPIYLFWDNITFLFEILSFIFIGAIFPLLELNIDIIIFAIILSIIVFLGRFIGVFIITSGFEIFSKYKEELNNKERIFLGFAGMRGLTTTILASLAYVEIGPETHLGQLILYSSIMVLIVTGLFQGIFIKNVAKKLGLLEEGSELEDILARKIVINTSLNILVDELEEKKISIQNFQRLSIPLKEELYILQERLILLRAEREREQSYLELSIKLNDQSRQALLDAHESGRIKDLAYHKTLDQLDHEKSELEAHYTKILSIEGTSRLIEETTEKEEIIEETDKSLIEAAINLLQDPNINKYLSKDFKLSLIKLKQLLGRGISESSNNSNLNNNSRNP